MVASRRQGATGKHQWVPGVAPDEMVEVGSHLRGVSMVGATEVARQRCPRWWGHSGGCQRWLGEPAAPVRHGGGKVGFKRQERARRRGSPRGQVGVGTAANFYGEAAAPGAGAAPRGRGHGGGGNRCSVVDEREMGQKKGTKRRPSAFQAAWWRRAEMEKGEGGLRALSRGGGGGKRGLVWWLAVRGDRQRPLAIGRGRWHCHANREGGGRGRLTRGPERDGGPDVSGGVWERAGERGLLLP
jgi:hypothetical protein